MKRVFAAASLSWMGVLVLATRVAARPRAGPVASPSVGGDVRRRFTDLPPASERSFHFWGCAVAGVCPVCGTLCGRGARRGRGRDDSTLDAASSACGSVQERFSSSPRFRVSLTLGSEWTTGDVPSNALRFAAGLPLGAAVLWLIVAASTSR